MAVGTKITGKAMKFTWDAVDIPTKSVKPKHARKLADTTDSTDYDETSKLLGQSQLPVSVEGSELSVEGFYYKGGELETKILAAVLSGDVTATTGAGRSVECTISMDGTTGYAYANFDVESLETTWETKEAVGFTMTLKLSGVWSMGAPAAG